VKAPNVKFVLAPQGASYGGLRACSTTPGSFKIEHSETPFPAFLRQGWSSLKFSLKSKIVKKENKKTPKYWFQSTGRGMRNDRTIRPASGLKRKPC